MEDGVKGSSVSPQESKVIHKAGWLKKSSGLLGLWKDRYIQILQTQLLVLDNEDEQKCLETLELASYERCQDQRTFLKRKKHFNLIPSQGTKAQDVKFQAKNTEERDVWIQALNEGINRGKNKVFDEVKVDPKCSLEHVTRDRVKVGAAKRRPPTRIHLKEVADAAADDSIRLGLEALDTDILTVVPPIPKEHVEEAKPRKEPVKIPKPPTKQNNLQTTEPSISETDSNVQAPHVPAPPPKILKENIYAREKLLSENAEANMENKSEHEAPTSTSEENVSNVVSTPPKPPPKILSDRMKIKWEGSSSDLLEKEILSVEKESKENLVDFDNPEKTSTPQIIISNDIEIEEKKDSTNSLQDKNEMKSNNADDDQNDTGDSYMESYMSVERTTEDTEEQEKDILDENEMTNNTQKSLTDVLLDDTNMSPRLLSKSEDYQKLTVRHSIDKKHKASSMGDLLSDSNIDFRSKEDGSALQLTKDRLNRVEMKLACGRQRTETLLNQVLNGQRGTTDEGNGLNVNSATLLNKVMRDLQEASDALMEIKGPKNATQEGVTDKQKEKQKELLALQRRTVHF
ncbi:pleckstrin homology domain-containing family O member 2 [Bufo gargarizans]|uniref:pleckstrin homology domain-containing family O member 2 n=1 Tax=Bufo gargarizans TaxID=30331 RepID=UPI001CF4334D|nr:pleckstrin homology domain-containing family O member 2 [Bufo gargarizans]